MWQSGNLYAYTLNNPVFYCDTSGNAAVAAALLIVGKAVLEFAITHPYITAGAFSVGVTALCNANSSTATITYSKSKPFSHTTRASSSIAASGSPDPDDHKPTKHKINETSKVKNQVKKLSREGKAQYQKAIDARKRGDTRGLNNHPLSGNRAGQWAIDLKGSGANRGAARVIYTVKNGIITVAEIVLNHKY